LRDIDLPSPGIGGTGHHLRRVAAKAISYIQVNKRVDGTHPLATDLRKFFQACADALTAYDATPLVANDASTDPVE
jgi:hypothetical protein